MSVPRSFRLRNTTMLEFFSGSSGRTSDILRPSKRSLSSAYLMFRYASSMLRLRDLPNLRGRANRNAFMESLDRMWSISMVLSTK